MTGDIRCKICGDRPPAKGRTICERCKKQRQRDGKPQVQAPQNPEVGLPLMQTPQDPGEQPPSNEAPIYQTGYAAVDVTTNMTPADKAWWLKNKVMGEDWPSWGGVEEHECVTCHKKFKTQLRLLRACELHV